MTRTYFIDCVDTFGELREVCRDHRIYVMEDIISDEELDEYIESDLSEAVGYESWHWIRDALNSISSYYCYYRRLGPFNYPPLEDEEFDGLKEDVLCEMDDADAWDEEECEACEDEPASPQVKEEPEEPPFEEADFSVSELITECKKHLRRIENYKEAAEKEAEAALEMFLAV